MPDATVLLGGLIGVIVGLAILSAILRWLWNSTMPDVFGLKTVTFWQALKLLLIAAILFGGPPSAAYYASDAGPAATGEAGE